MAEVELKPCPFCGCNDPDYIEARSEETKPTYAIRCPNCGTGIFRAKIRIDNEVWEPFNSMDEAVIAWNRRADNGH